VAPSLGVAIEATVGFLTDRLVVDGVEHSLRRERGGWIPVPIDAEGGGGRVRYDGLRDRVIVESPHGRVDIQFRFRRTTFTWSGRQYGVGPMVWGHLMITEGERPAATGRLTLSGVRIGYVAPELRPIASELAVGLAHRAVTIYMAASAGH
jgi:hypothetical protein